MQSVIEKTRKFLKDNSIDYLLVNSTNEFLVEYSKLEENARFKLTNFSGSTGDAVISKDKIFLFVDGRYHEQADLEVDKDIVDVVKMDIGESFFSCLEKKLSHDSTLAICSKKNSIARIEILNSKLKQKNIKIRLIDFDPVLENKPQNILKKAEQISKNISGISADEKFLKISASLKKSQAYLITNLEEVSYLCNLRDFSTQFSSKIEGKCLITKEKAILFSNYESIKIGEKFEMQPLENFENYTSRSKSKFFTDKTSITAFDYSLIKNRTLILKENIVKNLKAKKTNSEINHLKKCFEKTDKAILALRDFIIENENLSEYDISKKLEENFYKFGAKSLSFKSIVAKDKNSALAHYSKDSKTEIIKDGSVVLIDCGAYFEGGYATDCTRVFVKGTALKWQKEVYTAVLKGFLKAFRKKITKNTTGYMLDNSARKLLERIAPKGFVFSHSLGHGIGINVHEAPPSLSPSPLAKTIIEKNMCFTIEPGLYNKDFGGVRLENSCYMEEKDGQKFIKSFSNMCFEKNLIDYDMLTKVEKKQLENFKVL